MKKNGRTIKEDILLIKRGMREFRVLLPGQLGMVFWKCILAAALPYIAIGASTCVVNELAGAQNRKSLFFYVSLFVGITFLCYLCKVYLETKIAVGYSRLFSTHELLLTRQTYHMPYEELEKGQVRSLRDKVSGTIDLSGGGMASLYWDMEVVFTNLCSAGIGIVLCADFFRQMGSNNKSVWEIVVTCIGLLGLVLLSAFVSCKMTGKRFDVAFEVFKEGAKYKRVGEYYMMQYLLQDAGALDVRIFSQEKLIQEDSQKRCYEHFAKGKEKELQAANRYDGVKLLCAAICGGCVYGMVGWNNLQGNIGPGQVLLQYGAVTGLILALSELAQIWTDLRNNNEHLIHFFAYMDLPKEDETSERENVQVWSQDSQKSAEKEDALAAVKSIRFENVSFRYPDSQENVLEHISLEITGGESLALVGQNGSGKTTLIKLLCGLYRPTEGRILLNNKDIREYPVEEYRRYLATVFQDFTLFAFSLGENVAAAGRYQEEKVINAIQEAGLGEKYSHLPKGLKQGITTSFDEDGVNLSGGEAQKLAIARALYKDAPIMILDEPTAALDPYAEAEIYERFQELSFGKTVLSISHRLSSCRMCDRIVVLKAGKIVQTGTHEELVQEEMGEYAKMWKKQAEYYR